MAYKNEFSRMWSVFVCGTIIDNSNIKVGGVALSRLPKCAGTD